MSGPGRPNRESSHGEEVAKRLESRPSDAPSRLKHESSPGEEAAKRPEGRPSSAPGRHIAVVGAGWAGLAAAIELQRLGHRVTVLEVRHEPGGRARQLPPSRFQAPLDNGQHLLLGAYHATLRLMRQLGCSPETRLWRMPLTLRSTDGEFQLRTPRLPAPWHALAGLAFARGLSAAERWAAVRLVWWLRQRNWHPEDTLTVAELMTRHRQPFALTRKLWAPLCLAALNTPIELACAQMFAHVLRDSLDGAANDSDLLLPRTDLSQLWPQAAAARLDMRYGQLVRSLQPGVDDIRVDGATYDAAVLAVPPYMVSRMIAALPGSAPLLESLGAFSYAPIATLTLQFTSAMPALTQPILMLREDHDRGHIGQWVFDRTRLLSLDPARPELTVVASQHPALFELSRSELMQRLRTQLSEQLALPPVAEAELIIEKRGTFESRPGLARPGHLTPWPRLALAGDYTDTDYPAVLEGAVRSGLGAATALHEALAA